jgi:hypothetical protein
MSTEQPGTPTGTDKTRTDIIQTHPLASHTAIALLCLGITVIALLYD